MEQNFFESPMCEDPPEGYERVLLERMEHVLPDSYQISWTGQNVGLSHVQLSRDQLCEFGVWGFLEPETIVDIKIDDDDKIVEMQLV